MAALAGASSAGAGGVLIRPFLPLGSSTSRERSRGSSVGSRNESDEPGA